MIRCPRPNYPTILSQNGRILLLECVVESRFCIHYCKARNDPSVLLSCSFLQAPYLAVFVKSLRKYSQCKLVLSPPDFDLNCTSVSVNLDQDSALSRSTCSSEIKVSGFPKLSTRSVISVFVATPLHRPRSDPLRSHIPETCCIVTCQGLVRGHECNINSVLSVNFEARIPE